jgi:hypothetical protein
MSAPLDKDQCALEALGHLQRKICLMWGSPELDVFISRLIMDSRDGQRQGLPMAVGAELLFLAQINKIIRAIDLISQQNLSLKEAYRIVDQGDQKRLEADALDNPLVSRDTVSRREERRTGSERRSTSSKTQHAPADGPFALFGQMVFRLVFSKAMLFIIALALTIKLLWPYFFK